MLSENGDVIKNRHDRTPDHLTVSNQNGGQTLSCHVASLLIGVVVWTAKTIRKR